MSTFAHTPGPWEADDGDGSYFCIFGADGNPVAILAEPMEPRRVNLLPLDEQGSPDGYQFAAQHQANARLIAASPDLLAFVAMVARCNIRFQNKPTISVAVMILEELQERAQGLIADATMEEA